MHSEQTTYWDRAEPPGADGRQVWNGMEWSEQMWQGWQMGLEKGQGRLMWNFSYHGEESVPKAMNTCVIIIKKKKKPHVFLKVHHVHGTVLRALGWGESREDTL